MIFNFPSQTEEILLDDIEKIKQCGCRQTTFSPLYVSSATTRKMEQSLGTMDYTREFEFYKMLDEGLCGGDTPAFKRETVWTFNRLNEKGEQDHELPVEELQVSYDEYPAIGSGSISYLNGKLYVNTFSLREYNEAIERGHMSIMGQMPVREHDHMRYCFLLGLYQLRFDKRAFKEMFGKSVAAALPVEMGFMRANGAFDVDDEECLVPSTMGRYLTLVMYRQFLSGMNNLRDQARAALTGPEHELLFGEGVRVRAFVSPKGPRAKELCKDAFENGGDSHHDLRKSGKNRHHSQFWRAPTRAPPTLGSPDSRLLLSGSCSPGVLRECTILRRAKRKSRGCAVCKWRQF